MRDRLTESQEAIPTSPLPPIKAVRKRAQPLTPDPNHANKKRPKLAVAPVPLPMPADLDDAPVMEELSDPE